MEIHLIVVKIFHSHPNMSTWWHKRNGQGLTKKGKIYPLETMNVQTKCCGNLGNSCKLSCSGAESSWGLTNNDVHSMLKRRMWHSRNKEDWDGIRLCDGSSLLNSAVLKPPSQLMVGLSSAYVSTGQACNGICGDKVMERRERDIMLANERTWWTTATESERSKQKHQWRECVR